MKSIFADGKTFGVYAEIDCCYALLNELYKKTEIHTTPLDKLIDKATGHSHAVEKASQALALVKKIVKYKKMLGATEKELEGDNRLLNNLSDLITNHYRRHKRNQSMTRKDKSKK